MVERILNWGFGWKYGWKFAHLKTTENNESHLQLNDALQMVCPSLERDLR
jgi:hypothetical protein